MNGPKRVQMSRQRPWRTEHPDAVIVARPSRWGNPFRVGDTNPYASTPEHPDGQPMDAVEAVALYRMATALLPAWVFEELRGRDLACWCPLDQPCHADVLLEIANGADR